VPSESEAREPAGAGLLEPLRAEPAEAAVLTDVDGTLAPIVMRPEEAAVPPRTAEVLRRLGEAYALVGCISGRPAEEARELVGVEEIAYAGNHGLELLLPGDAAPRPHPSLEGVAGDAPRFAAGLDPDRLAAAGLRLEDKGPIQALHWRGSDDDEEAERVARELAAEAEGDGLAPHWGRKVLELRPAGGAGKDVAVAALLGLAARASRAIYGGDDTTDLDAFRRLRELRENGSLEVAVCVGISSEEGPADLGRESDMTVEGPEGWLAALEALAGGG
jgi:trehalose 6-phosphate phosphatase